jgi:hypothetical protein
MPLRRSPSRKRDKPLLIMKAIRLSGKRNKDIFSAPYLSS